MEEVLQTPLLVLSLQATTQQGALTRMFVLLQQWPVMTPKERRLQTSMASEDSQETPTAAPSPLHSRLTLVDGPTTLLSW